MEKGKKNMDELKKCPFCGGKAAVVVNDGVKVMCITCGAQTDGSLTHGTGGLIMAKAVLISIRP